MINPFSFLTEILVDAHVGKALFRNAIRGALRDQGKTVIFVTHALHFLSQCDYICTLRDGRIAAHGTYEALVQGDEEFARLDRQFGGSDAEQEEDPHEPKKSAPSDLKLEPNRFKGSGTGTQKGKLIAEERRTTGSIPLIGQSLLPCKSVLRDQLMPA